MNQSIQQLQGIMFQALERLNKENMNDEELKLEIDRAKAIGEIGKVIVESAKTEILLARLTGNPVPPEPRVLGNGAKQEPPKKIPSVPMPPRFDQDDEDLGDDSINDKMGAGGSGIPKMPPDYSTRKIK